MKRGSLLGLLGATLALLLLPLPLAAQTAAATVSADPERMATLTVGDLLPLTIEVSHPDGTVAILPVLANTWGDLEIRQTSAPVVTASEAGGLVTRQTVHVAIFAPGIFQTPFLPIRVTDRSGASYEVTAPPLSLTVNSVLSEPEQPLRDLKGQAEVRVPLWAPIGGGLALLAVVLLLVWWLWRRGSLQALSARTALDRALAELDHLAATDLLQNGHYKEFYQTLTLTVRRHLEREFGIDVEDRTTRELRAQLRRLRLPADTARRLLDLLAEADLVKFADATPTREGALTLLGEARVVVQAISAARRPPAVAVAQPAQVGSGA